MIDGCTHVSNCAHHIVAGTAKREQEARMVLERINIGINDAINGVFLPIEKGVSQATYHPRLRNEKDFTHKREVNNEQPKRFLFRTYNNAG